MAALAGCTGVIDDGGPGEEPIDPVKDHVVGFRFASPLGVGQLGSNVVFDACVTEAGCEEQLVELMSVTIDRSDVVTSSPVPGESRFDVTAIAPGTATVNVTAHNTGVEAQQVHAIQVLEPTRFELRPVATYTGPGGEVTLQRTCAMDPIRFETNVVATFMYQLYADTTPLLGSGYYPWDSNRLTRVSAPDPAADGGMVRMAASPTAGNANITAMIGEDLPDLPIRVVDSYDSLVLSDQFRAPTAGQETLIWADARSDNELVCFDAAGRTLVSETPDICSVVDHREANLQFRGPGPYELRWIGTGTCRVTLSLPGTGLSATRDYLPMP